MANIMERVEKLKLYALINKHTGKLSSSITFDTRQKARSSKLEDEKIVKLAFEQLVR